MALTGLHSWTVSHAFSGLITGSHRVDIQAYDNVNNVATRSVNFTVDVTMPTLTITAPTASQNLNVTSVLASWTGGDVGTGLQGFRYHADAGAWSNISMNLELTAISKANRFIPLVSV